MKNLVCRVTACLLTVMVFFSLISCKQSDVSVVFESTDSESTDQSAHSGKQTTTTVQSESTTLSTYGEERTTAATKGSTAHTHDWGEWRIIRNATCNAEGRSERVCACGEKTVKTVPMLVHTGDGWIVDEEATLRESGKKHQICSACGIAFNEMNIPPLTVNPVPGITDVNQELFRPYYALANCRRLEGNPVVVLIFIDDNESAWTKNEVVTFTQEHILPGLDYLENTAKTWGVNLDFVIQSYSTPLNGYEIKYEGVVNRNLHNGGSTKDVLDQAAMDIGCASNWELYSYYKEKYPTDDIIFLNFLNKSGKSYARHAISTGYVEYSEHCVIFADYLGGSPAMRQNGSRASTVAHELLHLFGAEDYYSPRSRERLANQNYPKDIMLWQYDNIEDNVIGDCTAFSVGWTDIVPDVCYEDAWWE